MLSVRELPVEEWDKLGEIDPFKTELPKPSEDWRVLVVERDGVIVGTTSLFTAVHWDCWWIDPASRERGGVLSLLLSASLQVLDAAEIGLVYTGVEASALRLQALLEKFGFTPAPGKLYLLKVADARLSLKREGG